MKPTRRGLISGIAAATVLATSTEVAAVSPPRPDAVLLTLGERFKALRAQLDRVREESVPTGERYDAMWTEFRRLLPSPLTEAELREADRAISKASGYDAAIEHEDAVLNELWAVVEEIEACPWKSAEGLVVHLYAVAFLAHLDDQFNMPERCMDVQPAAMWRLIDRASCLDAN